MSPPVEVAFCGEGPTDAVVARRLIIAAGATPGVDYVTGRRARGKDALDRRLPGFGELSRHQPVLVLRDLDDDACCPAALVVRLLPQRPSRLLLRVVVPCVEAWLMADHGAFAATFGLIGRQMPTEPERLARPRDDLVRLLAESRDRNLLRRLGAEGPAGIQPQLLAAELAAFARKRWHPMRAARAAPSLARALARLRGVAGHG